MKTSILLFVFSLSITAGYSQFADNAIKLNLFGLAVGQVNLSYERALNENSTVQLSAGFVSRTFDGSSIGSFTAEQKDAGFIVIPEYRYYFTEAVKGMYAGAFVRYKTVTTTFTTTGNGDDSETEYERSSIGGGGVLGYQFIVADKVALDLFTGPQYKSTDRTLKSGEDGDFEFEGDSDGIGLRFGFNVGIVF